MTESKFSIDRITIDQASNINVVASLIKAHSKDAVKKQLFDLAIELENIKEHIQAKKVRGTFWDAVDKIEKGKEGFQENPILTPFGNWFDRHVTVSLTEIANRSNIPKGNISYLRTKPNRGIYNATLDRLIDAVVSQSEESKRTLVLRLAKADPEYFEPKLKELYPKFFEGKEKLYVYKNGIRVDSFEIPIDVDNLIKTLRTMEIMFGRGLRVGEEQ